MFAILERMGTQPRRRGVCVYSVARALLLVGVCGAALLGPSVFAQSTNTDAYRAQLQSQLNQLEAQIASQQKILDVAQSQDVSLSRDITILNAQIAQAELSIKARNLAIQELTSGIQDKQNTIFGLNTKLNSELQSLSAMLRAEDQLDATPLMVVALSSQTLSDFFTDAQSFDQINTQIQSSFTQITATRAATQQEQDDLQNQLEEETQLRQVQQLQEQQIQSQQQQKQQILAETKGQEKSYKAIIAQNQKSAAQIRTALFQLNGSAAIPFAKALDYATAAGKQTGIRPAFLLGIIAEESNLGENVGTGSWTVDMKAPRDTVPFKAITASLGLNPDTMPVSKKQWYGYGGAMGPAQFIPSTWVGLAGYVQQPSGSGNWVYDASSDRVGKRTGNTPPNPWNPQDAFMAAALYLTDSGAGSQTSSGEFKAAMCYLAGCGNVGNKSLQFYGNSVAALARKYQCQIDIVGGNPGSTSCN